MDAVDLNLLKAEPTFTGSVQSMYSIRDQGAEYFLCKAEDRGSIFDIGALYAIGGSGQARNTLRHVIFTAIGDSGKWQDLRINNQRFSDQAYLDGLLQSATMDELKGRGAPTHHIGSVDPITGEVAASAAATPSPLVLIERVPVVRPRRTHLHGDSVYDYKAYIEASAKVIALEQIVRLGLPGGSAVLNRLKELGGASSPEAAKYLTRYDAPTPLFSWSSLPRPICDWQSKYEDYDRALEAQEALYISGISARTLSSVGDLLMLCSLMVDSMLSRGGLTLWDLKWEVAQRGNDSLVADTMDHDSMRITHAVSRRANRCNIHFNKQAIRDYYKIFHADWVAAIYEVRRKSTQGGTNRPFMALYEEEVERGTYPAIPTLDPDYAELQSAKYQYVTDVARGLADEAHGAELAQQELRYYERRGRLDELVEYTAARSMN